jgi:antitoxin component of MazEF toxin-antitoxin module
MIQQKLRRQGNSLVVTIPKEEVERLHLREGQTLLIDVQPLELRPMLSPELREVFEESWKQNEAGYRALTNR